MRVKVGFRVPSIKKRIAAHTSVKRFFSQNPGFKAPRGFGWLSSPKKAAYNRVYNRTTKGCAPVLFFGLTVSGILVWLAF